MFCVAASGRSSLFHVLAFAFTGLNSHRTGSDKPRMRPQKPADKPADKPRTNGRPARRTHRQGHRRTGMGTGSVDPWDLSRPPTSSHPQDKPLPVLAAERAFDKLGKDKLEELKKEHAKFGRGPEVTTLQRLDDGPDVIRPRLSDAERRWAARQRQGQCLDGRQGQDPNRHRHEVSNGVVPPSTRVWHAGLEASPQSNLARRRNSPARFQRATSRRTRERIEAARTGLVAWRPSRCFFVSPASVTPVP